MRKITLLFIFCFACVLNSFGQVREITESEYWQQYRSAADMSFEISKRVTSKEESFENGKLSSTTESVDEYLKPDKRRHLAIYTSAKTVRKNELIQIGEKYYCRLNNGAWKVSDSWCADLTLTSGPKEINSKFTVEETKINNRTATLYQYYRTYKSDYELAKDKEKLFYFHDKFWVDSDGFLLRREMEYGSAEPKTVGSKEVVTYEYDLKNITITAPILGTKTKTKKKR
jgi:hypothetical protein